METLPEKYGENYFEHGVKMGLSGYENYRWLPERIYREVRAVIHLLGIKPQQRVLEVGCAKGYWVRGFREYGINAYGYDISDYAISHCDESVKNYLSKEIPNEEFDFIVSRNTFEHIKADELEFLLKKFIKITEVVFFTVPLIDPQTGDYVMQMPDITHEIKWTNADWTNFCEKCGWEYVINYSKIDGLHENFKDYKNSIGFYILKNTRANCEI